MNETGRRRIYTNKGIKTRVSAYRRLMRMITVWLHKPYRRSTYWHTAVAAVWWTTMDNSILQMSRELNWRDPLCTSILPYHWHVTIAYYYYYTMRPILIYKSWTSASSYCCTVAHIIRALYIIYNRCCCKNRVLFYYYFFFYVTQCVTTLKLKILIRVDVEKKKKNDTYRIERIFFFFNHEPCETYMVCIGIYAFDYALIS